MKKSSVAAASAATLALTFGIVPAVLTPATAWAQRGGGIPFSQDNDPLVDTLAGGKGRVNYGAGIVKATGYGAPPARGVAANAVQARLMALGAAKADALRNLAMSVSAIQVTATTKVKNYVLQSDVVETKLDAILDSPRIVSQTYQRDGTAVVVVELPLYGEDSVASVVLPEVLKDVPPAPVYPAPAPAETTFHGPDQPAIPITPRIRRPNNAPLPGGDPGLTPLSDPGPFTAVIVDCRGLGIEAIMSPKLMDSTGREVYGTVRISPEYAIETGIVGYPRSMAEAIRGARAGSHPLIVRAVRAADKFRFNPVVSLEDADRILAANNRDRFLERTAVIFLVDPIR